MVLENNKFIQKIKLSFLKGLHKPMILSNREINRCRLLNEPDNTGVEEVLNKKNVIVVFHDYYFRDPPERIVKRIGDNIIFPSVRFPEIKGAISASPSGILHNFLVTKRKSIKHDWASLLIGF